MGKHWESPAGTGRQLEYNLTWAGDKISASPGRNQGSEDTSRSASSVDALSLPSLYLASLYSHNLEKVATD